MAARGVILVVDDNQKNRLLCRQNLEMESYEVLEAANGLQGLNVAMARRPDLILLDIMMPEMDGYQMLQQARLTPELKETSILMLTAKAGTEDVVRAMEMGANDYLRKPFDIEEMIARAQTLVNLNQTRQALRQHQERMEGELRQAAAIQTMMLPTAGDLAAMTLPLGLSIVARTSPSSQVNGDFYDLRLQEGGLSLAMWDCKGHGVGAGLVSMTVRAMLRAQPPGLATSMTCLSEVEQTLQEMLPEGEFVAISHWTYQAQGARLTMSFAGMPPPVLVRPADGSVSVLDVRGRPPLGLNRYLGWLPTTEMELELRTGDRLLAFSDGFSEAMDSDGELFGIPTEKVLTLARRYADAPLPEMVNGLWDQWSAFHGGQQDDDCTLLVLQKL